MIRRKLLAGVLAGLSCSFAGAQQLGSPFTIRSSPTIRHSECDVAYDLTRDMYGLVFGRQDGTIRVQRFRGNGSLVGGEITLGSGNSGRIANLNLRNRFLVCWKSSPNVLARIVDPASGAVSSTLTLTTSLSNQGQGSFDVTGDATTAGDAFTLVWTSNQRALAKRLILTSSFQLVLGTTTVLRNSGGNVHNIRISTSGGPSQRYLVVWTENLETDIYGAVIDQNARLLDTAIRIDLGGTQRRRPTGVDGDGRNFVVAYQKDEPGSTSIQDVLARSVTFDPLAPSATFASPERVIEGDAGDDEFHPTVAFTGSTAVVAYLDPTATSSDAWAKSVEPFGCHDCEPRFALDTSNSDGGVTCSSVALRASGANSETALLVWTRAISGGGTTIRGRYYTAEDGIPRDLGGGCGSGGEAHAACARNGHGEFRVRVRDAAGGNAFLVLSPRRIDMQCGPCELVPDPIAGVVVSTSVGASGRGSVSLPIPSGSGLVGTRFYAQWLVLQNGAPCAALPGHFSNALEVEIQ